MKAIGFCLGLRGDLCISTVAARSFKQEFPAAHLTLGVHKDFADMMPLFYQHPYYDGIHLYESYNGWPSQHDQDYLASAKYDHVFNGMPTPPEQWWKTLTQTELSCVMHGLPIPFDISPVLNPWFHNKRDKDNSWVAFAGIGAFYSGWPNEKSYSPEQAQNIVNYLIAKGYKVLQLGSPEEPTFTGCVKRSFSYFESVKALLNCKALVTVDTGLCWLAGAYKFPVLASYGHRYYGKEFVKNIQCPGNPNAIYIDGPNVADIPMEEIYNGIDKLLS